MADIYAIWYAAQVGEGETMQDGLLRIANLLPNDSDAKSVKQSAADNAALRERVKVLEDALRGLVACKDTEKRLHMLHAMGHGTDYDQHRAEFRFAWIAASAALEATK